MKHSSHGRHALSLSAFLEKKPTRKSHPITIQIRQYGNRLHVPVTRKQIKKFINSFLSAALKAEIKTT